MTFISTDEIARLILAVLLLLFSAHVFGYLFDSLKMPKVIGEIAGGMALGPSLLGHISPKLYDWIFNAFTSETQALSVFYWFGLILLMFISGMEQEKWDENLDKKLIISLIAVSTAIPIGLGYAAAGFFDMQALAGVKQSIPAMKIIFAISMAITSIPVISKIFMDIGIMHTRFAKTILTIAVLHDVLLWIGVAAAEGIANHQAIQGGFWKSAGYSIFIVIVFFALSILVVPHLMTRTLKNSGIIRYSTIGMALLFCLLFVLAANLIDVNVMFGALLAGLAIGIGFSGRMEKVKENIKAFSMAFFIPLYFALVGIRINLIEDFNLFYFAVITILSFVFQGLAVYPVMMLMKKTKRLAVNVIVSLTAKGGPGIVLATVTYEAGIINGICFTSLILSALVTSAIAGWWLRRQAGLIENIL